MSRAPDITLEQCWAELDQETRKQYTVSSGIWLRNGYTSSEQIGHLFMFTDRKSSATLLCKLKSHIES